MCTVTWKRTADGYHMLCNRDEQRTRRPAHPPQRFTRNGVEFLAPTDGDHGGAWIGVNEFGLSLCLLNRYQNKIETAGDYVSRGRIVISLLTAHSITAVRKDLLNFDLHRFRPFSLIAIASHEPAVHIAWDLQDCTIDTHADDSLPFVSSSYDTAGARAARRSAFAALTRDTNGPTLAALREFHQSHAPERGPFSPCMHRMDAHTVSFSEIEVSATAISFSYLPQSPCQPAAQTITVSLIPTTCAGNARTQ